MRTKLSLLLSYGLSIASLTVAAADADVARLATANNAFAFKLLKQLSAEQPKATLFVSPYSAATALQMAVNGAAGETRAEMQRALEINGLPLSKLNEASKAVAALINSGDTNGILTTANALWYRQGASIQPGFVSANQQFFSSMVKALDFGSIPAAEIVINQWASDQTHGHITGIANGIIDPNTDLILANAIYFKGQWVCPFDKTLTKNRPFHPAAGPLRERPAMEMSTRFLYRKGSDYQAVRLPYRGRQLAMYVFLPDPGSSPEKLLQGMTARNWDWTTIPGFGECKGRLVLPRFKIETAVDLVPALKALGMKTAFDPAKANFSEMFTGRHWISKVRQKAFLEVNEEGTEGAASTILGITKGMDSKPPKPFEMIVDRPFLFAVVDSETDLILFIGLVEDL
jgi:serpin B